MQWLVLLVIAGLVAGDDLQLGDRIVATEQECSRIYKLNENWGFNNVHEQVVQYVDLYFLCEESLSEDKYAYIDKNNVDISQYPGEDDKFPIMTSEGEVLVSKPPQRKPNDEESMTKKLADYLTKMGGNNNPIYRLMNIQSELGQAIVDQQVECDILALFLIKHPDDKESEGQHIECVNKLNCLKEKFMMQHQFTRENYPKFFPILYKGKGTMINTPPKSENSLCEVPTQPEEHKKELEKWIDGIENIGEKLGDLGELGTGLIEKIKKLGMAGKDKVLTRDELNHLMNDVKSITIMDDDDEDDDDYYDDDEDGSNTYNVYESVLLEKLAELEAKGVQIAHSKLDKVKPAIEKVEHIVSATGDQLKKFESTKVEPAVIKTAKSLNDAETKLETKSKNALKDVKDDISFAGGAAKMAASIAKEEGSTVMNKLFSKQKENKSGDGSNGASDDAETGTESTDSDNTWLSTIVNKMVHSDYLPDNYDEIRKPGLLSVLKAMGGRNEDGTEKLSDEELTQMLKTVRENARKKAKDLNLKKDEVLQAASIVRGIMHSLLSAASEGQGAAKDMNTKEIGTARSLVDKLVDYATAELIDDEGNEKVDKGNALTDESEEDNHVVKKDDAVNEPTDNSLLESKIPPAPNQNAEQSVGESQSEDTANSPEENQVEDEAE